MKPLLLAGLLGWMLSSCSSEIGSLVQTSPGVFAAEEEGSHTRALPLNGIWLSSTLPNPPEGTSRLQPVPGGWGNLGGNLSGGVYFLRAQVRVPGASGYWSLELPPIFCSYRLWVNGDLIHSQGLEGQDSYREKVHPALAGFRWKGSSTEILLEVVNHTTPKGGIQGPILLTPGALAQRRWDLRTAWNYFLAGVVFFIFLFHTFQYTATRRRIADIYLALFAFFSFLRIILTEQKIFSWILDLPYEQHYDLEFSTVFLIIHFLTLYLKGLFPQKWKNRVIFPLLGLNLVFLLLLIPLDNGMFVQIFDYYPLVVLPLIGINIGMVVAAARRRYPGALILLSMTAVMFLIGLSDVAFAGGYHSFGSFSSLGLAGFLLVQFYFLVSRSAWEDLQALRITEELASQNLNQSRFMANTSHELKTPLHGLLGMAELLHSSGELPKGAAEDLDRLGRSASELDREISRLLGTMSGSSGPKPGP